MEAQQSLSWVELELGLGLLWALPAVLSFTLGCGLLVTLFVLTGTEAPLFPTITIR